MLHSISTRQFSCWWFSEEKLFPNTIHKILNFLFSFLVSKFFFIFNKWTKNALICLFHSALSLEMKEHRTKSLWRKRIWTKRHTIWWKNRRKVEEENDEKCGKIQLWSRFTTQNNFFFASVACHALVFGSLCIEVNDVVNCKLCLIHGMKDGRQERNLRRHEKSINNSSF